MKQFFKYKKTMIVITVQARSVLCNKHRISLELSNVVAHHSKRQFQFIKIYDTSFKLTFLWKFKYDSLLQMDKTHRHRIALSFQKGLINFERSNLPYSRVPYEVTLEQTNNADIYHYTPP